ncbi:MAG: KH domain-containing protein [Myxococcales bacterium]|nr:KH domain-containing protein [Myxococcales bacterium]
MVNIKELVEIIVTSIVDYPDDVQINIVESGATIVIELSVAKSDIGKVIGKQGNMARALRTIISNAATKLKKRSVLQILE